LLRLGHGRAGLYCATHNCDEFSDLIFAACLQDQRYDHLFDNSHAEYLAAMLDRLSMRDELLPLIWKKLLHSRPGRAQGEMHCLAAVYARQGNAEAMRVLRLVSRRNIRRGNYKDIHNWVWSDGKRAFIQVLKLLEKHWKQFEQNDMTYYTYMALEDALGKPRYNTLMRSALHKYPGATLVSKEQHRYDHVKRAKLRRNKAIDKGPLPTYEQIAKLGPDWLAARDRLWDFAWRATAEEFKKAAKNLPVNEKERHRYLEYLFRERPFPLDPKTLIKDTRSKHPSLRNRAYKTLKMIKSPVVRAFALRDLKRVPNGAFACELLVKNYQAGDAELVLDRAKKCKYNNERHRVLFALRDMVEEHPELSPKYAYYIYDYDPCAICRNCIVDIIVKRGWLTQEMREECKYDSQNEIRKMVQELDA